MGSGGRRAAKRQWFTGWPGLAWHGLVFSCLVLQPPPRPLSPPSVTHPWTTKIGLACRADATQPGTDHMGPQFRPWVGANSEGRMDGRMGGSSACVSPAKQGLGGGDGMHWVSLSCHMFLVLGSRPQSTTAAAQQTTGDVTRSPGPTDRPANAASSQAKGDAARETWCLSMPSEAPWRTSPVLASEFQNRRGFPPQASAFCLKPSPRQSVSQPAETERNEPLLPSAAPPNSNVSGSQPSARLSTTCLRYIAAPVCPK